MTIDGGNGADDPRASDRDEALGRAVVLSRMFGADTKASVGRFRLMERVGRGAMGTVWAAYDPDLDRRVAVKLLHAGAGVADAAEDQRVLAEARVLAKLSHPNVVHAYEVGVANEQVFIAMEFVAGSTLRAWTDERERTWEEVLAMYVQAGRGLEAGHAAGVVHRDFKPDNALVGSDGRVRVVDFGLAGATGAPESSAGHDAQGSELSTRARGGTPAYMAPEQLDGVSDARADQFSFCVALFEALAGERPFAPAKRDGPDMERLPSAVPGWLRSSLARGLAVDPDQRHASMAALLELLDHDPSRGRRTRWALAGVVVLVGGALVAGRFTASPAEPCPDAEPLLAGVWDESRRIEVAGAIEAAAPGFAEQTLARTQPRLDAYAEAWVAGRNDACMATHVRHEQSEALLDARVRCLDDRRRALVATADTLADADAGVAARAFDLVDALPDVLACSDAERVQAETPPPNPEIADDVREILDELAQARALAVAGRWERALEMTTAIHARATALDYEPLTARAEWAQGASLGKRGDVAGAEGHLRVAYRLARHTGQSELAGKVAARLGYLLARFGTDPDDALTWGGLAILEGELSGDLSSQGAGHNARGIARAKEGEHAQALAEFRRAMDLIEPLGPSVDLLMDRTNLARTLRLQGKVEKAAEFTRVTLADAEKLLGPSHPNLLPHIELLAELEGVLDRPAEGKALLVRGVEIARRAHGPEDHSTALMLQRLGSALLSLGELDDAREAFEEALSISEKARERGVEAAVYGLEGLGRVYSERGETERAFEYFRRAIEEKERSGQHRNAAVSRGRLARALLDAGRPTEALPVIDGALEIFESRLGPDHIDVAEGLWVRARALDALGQHDRAASDLERAIAIAAQAFEPDAPQHADGWIRLAEVRLNQERADDATALATRALERVEPLWPEHETARVRFLLARSLAASGDADRARTLASEAAAALRRGPVSLHAEAAKIEAWSP